jgi:hypothetical protein
MKVLWDLCSGLGGWSEAFVQDGWIVIRIETNEALQYVPHTLKLDVRQWADWADDLPKPDVILASPPCLEFSTAYMAPRSVAAREGRPFEPDMSIVNACKDIIDAFTPTWWCIENVNGAISAFDPLLGRFSQKVGPFFLWGNFPTMLLPGSWTYSKSESDSWSSDPLRANKRALIPFEVSFAMLEAVKSQKQIGEWV